MFLLAFLVLLPIYASGERNLGQIYTSLSISHLSEKSPLLWVPYAFVWIFTLFAFYFLSFFITHHTSFFDKPLWPTQPP